MKYWGARERGPGALGERRPGGAGGGRGGCGGVICFDDGTEAMQVKKKISSKNVKRITQIANK